MVIEDTKCQITAYQPASPIIWNPLVTKESIPESPLLRAIMIGHSNLGVYLSYDDIAKLFGGKIADAENMPKEQEKMTKMFEMTAPTAAENPWKGMKYALDYAYVIESDRGKFLLYQLSCPGGNITGKSYGQLREVAGRWVNGGASKSFGPSAHLTNIPEEFAKQKESTGLQALPLEPLLK